MSGRLDAEFLKRGFLGWLSNGRPETLVRVLDGEEEGHAR